MPLCCRTRQIIVAVFGLLLITLIFLPGSVFAAHLISVFELEGNAAQDSLTLPPDDWEALFDFPDVLDSSELEKVFIAHTGEGGTSFIGGGSKDEQPISAWRWVEGGNSPPKAIIWDAYAANYVDDDGDLVYYFGADRLSNTGNTNIGFWFFKNSISLNPDGTFSGTHEVGDILIVSEFTQGGETPITAVYRWIGGDDPLEVVSIGTAVDCADTDEGDCICATVNDGEETAPWPYRFKNNDSLVFPAGVFLEGGFCGDIFGGATQCFGSFMAVTRSSDQINAVLEDFELNQLGSCRPDLQVTKTAPARVLTNSQYTYNIQVTNTSNTFATGVTLTDTLPPEVTYVSGTVVPGDAGSFEYVAGPPKTFTCDLGVMAAGETVNIAITVTAPGAPAPLGVVNTAVVTLTQEDPDPGDNTSQTTTVVVEQATGPALSIAKFGPESIIAGEALTYTIAISNTGDADAENVTVTDTFPAALTDISWTCEASPGSDCGSGSGNGNISINNATVAVGGTITYTVNATVAPSTDPGSITNTASVAGIDDDVTTQVIRRYDVIAQKTCAGTVLPGSPLSYSIVVSNSGISDAEGISVVDNFPAEVLNVSWTCVGAGGATCSNNSGSGDINETADIPAGGSLTFTVNATLDANVPGNTQIPNYVTAGTPDGEDINTGNNRDIACLLSTPESLPDISITKAAPAQVATGSIFTYILTAVNNGPATATGVTLVDVLPTGVIYNSATIDPPDAGTVDAANNPEIIFDFGTMISGESVTVEISVTAPGSAQTILNQAEVGLNEEDSDPDDNFAEAETLVVEQIEGSDLSISKSGPLALVAGEQITYTIIVGNTGDTAGTDTVTDLLPAEIDPISWSCSATGTSAYDPASGTGNVSVDVTVNPNEFVTITVQGIVLADTVPGNIINTAELELEEENSSWETEIIRRYDTQIAKTCPDGVFRVGDALNYTVTVTNTGLSDALGIIVTDDLASELENITWTCIGTQGAVFNAAGSGDLNETVELLPAGGTLEYTITAQVGASAVPGSEIPNTASITTPDGEDSIPSNNTTSPCSISIYIEQVPIPTLSEWGMIIMLFVLGWVGYRHFRRQADF